MRTRGSRALMLDTTPKNGGYLSWARLDEYGRPIRWTKAHECRVDERGNLHTLCGARMPADAEGGNEHNADGYCRRCERIARG